MIRLGNTGIHYKSMVYENQTAIPHGKDSGKGMFFKERGKWKVEREYSTSDAVLEGEAAEGEDEVGDQEGVADII